MLQITVIAHRVGVAVVSALVVSSADAQHAARPEPRGRPAVAAIVKALDVYHLVAIGETHRNQQVHDVIAEVVRDARFLPNGGDIVVEFGNARYQDRVDRYIDGQTVDERDLAQAWRDAVNILVWDAPVYARFFAIVRDVNRARSPATRLRVLVADPAIDWSTIHERDAWEQIAASRDRHFADVVEREVLARGRRALLVFGSGHVDDESAFDAPGKPDRTRSPNLAELLQAEHPGVTLRITAGWMNADLDEHLARWRPPALLSLKGTSLGAAHAGPGSQGPRLEDLADQFLYLGATSSLVTSTPAPEVYGDTAYLRELLRRDAIQGGKNAAELRRLAARFLSGGTQ